MNERTTLQRKWTAQPRLMAAGAEKDERPTPDAFFAPLDAEFGFTLDAAASSDNAKCARYYSLDDDGLQQSWEGVVWCNPPYSEVGAWVEKGLESARNGATVVMLLPAATDARWFHELVLGNAEIRWVRGRLRFVGQANSAPFASMVVIFRPPGSLFSEESA